ncbi:cytochrome P450 [Macrolepiota fuliginosa MF-IS2]|uniref:Cytochrome P450 n=1 Tax=Macrolepiota fuliginosa MF-IS2 TaxID=1400762 RepID=A0A9P5XE04_9AGAR|nr:cytochrome P450 [Macrolepiota fuliginosa MF-IS2]
MFEPGPIDVSFICCAVLAYLFCRYKTRRQPLYPPGPKPLPLIGNALDIPTVKGFQVFAQWSKQYSSDILYLGALGKHIVVLNSVEAANDLCGERSSIYSSRPHLTMCGELMNAVRFMAVMPYGDAWRARRRMFQRHFPPSDPSRITISRSEEFVRKYLLPNILNSPKDFHQHIRNAVGGIILSLAYGLRIQRFDDPWIRLAEMTLHTTTEAAVVGRYLVDIIPALKYVPEWMPGAGFQKVGREGRKIVNYFFNRLYDAAVQEIIEGVGQPSFVGLAMDESDETKTPMKEVIRETAGVFFAGGSDTTVAALNNFVLLMTLHPQIQSKAQQEVDAIVGHDRFPNFSDKASMPYLTAVLKEVLRWRPVVPAGMPHCSTADDVYRGYFIPKGSIIINNTWAILHNDQTFPNPDHFDPTRFLTSTGQLRKDVLDPETIATFGFGRRLCPGSQIALATLFVAAASILASFNILKPLNEKGEEIDPVVHYSGKTMVDHPTPFGCRFIPRSKDAEALIQSEVLNLDEKS